MMAMMAESMDVDAPPEGGSVTSVVEAGDLRGNSAPHGLDPPEPMDAAVIGGGKDEVVGKDELSQATNLRGCDVQDINATNSTSFDPTSSGHAAAEPGQQAAPSAPPAAEFSCAPDALRERLRRMLAVTETIKAHIQVSQKPPPATPQPPAFRAGSQPTDARLRTVLQVWLSMVFRRDCRAADALAVCCAWLMQEPLGGFLLGHLVSVSCMWPGALPARI